MGIHHLGKRPASGCAARTTYKDRFDEMKIKPAS